MQTYNRTPHLTECGVWVTRSRTRPAHGGCLVLGEDDGVGNVDDDDDDDFVDFSDLDEAEAVDSGEVGPSGSEVPGENGVEGGEVESLPTLVLPGFDGGKDGGRKRMGEREAGREARRTQEGEVFGRKDGVDDRAGCSHAAWEAYGKLMDVDDLVDLPCKVRVKISRETLNPEPLGCLSRNTESKGRQPP